MTARLITNYEGRNSCLKKLRCSVELSLSVDIHYVVSALLPCSPTTYCNYNGYGNNSRQNIRWYVVHALFKR